LEEAKENDPGFKPNIIATGGLAFLVASKSIWIKIHDADLTLKGLKILMDKNR